MVATAALVLLVGVFTALALALVARRHRRASRHELERLVGRVVQVRSILSLRGPYASAAEGTLVALEDSAILLQPTLVPVPPAFARMVADDGVVRIPLREVLDVTCAGHVVRDR